MKYLNRTQTVVYLASGLVFLACLSQIHIRIQSTIVGYELGRLKAEEKAMIDQRGNLHMELAKLTTKQSLTLFAESEDTLNTNLNTVASR
jgi:hypothetical protein